jgi:peptidyl-prolyl cis-trans isomerase C
LFIKLRKISKITAFFCITFLVLIAFSLQGAANQQQGDQEKPLAIVNDEIITLGDFDKYWEMIPDNYKMQLNKEDVLEQLITQTLLIQKAEELNLSEDPEISFQIKNTVDQILIQSLLEKEIIEKTALNDDDINSYYEENKENYWLEEEVHALDILVETKEKAEEIVQKLEEGQEFDTLAKESSIASTASMGGDIGFISKGTLTAEIEEQLFVLNTGEISEIIPTEKGFHIFKVVEKNPSRYRELAEVKGEIENEMLPLRQQEAFDQYLQNTEDQAVIEKNVELLQEKEVKEEEQE